MASAARPAYLWDRRHGTARARPRRASPFARDQRMPDATRHREDAALDRPESPPTLGLGLDPTDVDPSVTADLPGTQAAPAEPPETIVDSLATCAVPTGSYGLGLADTLAWQGSGGGRGGPGGPGGPGHSRYRAVRLHARGGLGEIFVAVDGELNREVALKEIQERHGGHAREPVPVRLRGRGHRRPGASRDRPGLRPGAASRRPALLRDAVHPGRQPQGRASSGSTPARGPGRNRRRTSATRWSSASS